ncbi:MAG TPA: PspC domain-containing protein [bacterium]|nr:PspC domain-containing protein [bacterium]
MRTSRLERSRTERVLFGVCGGLARHLGLDPDLVRVAFLLAVALDGTGWVLYLAGYLLIPEEAGTDAESEPARDRSGRTGGLLLVALAVLAYLIRGGFDALFPWNWTRTWTLLIPILLLGSGALLIWPRLRESAGLSPESRPRRSVSDRVLAGVAGGIAREVGIDPGLLRLAMVAGTLVTWITVPLYALLVVVLPEEDPTGSAPESAPEDAPPPPAPPPAPTAPAGQGPPETDR